VEQGSTYRHPNCLDVDMHVLRVLRMDPDKVRLRVLWVNQRSRLIHETDEVEIGRDQINEWKQVGPTPRR
jgi:hypothetical protein